MGLSYFGKSSHRFSIQLKALIKNKFDINVNVYYASLKTGSYYQLKCSTPTSLISNVVYKFNCLCDTNVTYIGMTIRQFGVRVEEHLHLKKVQQYRNTLMFANHARVTRMFLTIFKTCNTQYSTTIQEALLIKNLAHNY